MDDWNTLRTEAEFEVERQSEKIKLLRHENELLRDACQRASTAISNCRRYIVLDDDGGYAAYNETAEAYQTIQAALKAQGQGP